MIQDKKRNNLILIILFLLFFITLIGFNGRNNLRAETDWDFTYRNQNGDLSEDKEFIDPSEDKQIQNKPNTNDSNKVEDVIGAICVVLLMVLSVCFSYIYLQSDPLLQANIDEDSGDYRVFMNRYEDKIESLKAGFNDGVNEEELKSFLPDETIDSVKDKIYKVFLNTQEARMKFDYNKLNMLCSNELYNIYISQLEVLKKKNNRNIRKNFKKNKVKLDKISEKDGLLIIRAFINVSLKNYVINDKTGKTVRGNKDEILNNIYETEFLIAKDKKSQKCPNCGDKLIGTTIGKCESCGSECVTKPSDFVLSRIECINK